jgi:hypothetical protein
MAYVWLIVKLTGGISECKVLLDLGESVCYDSRLLGYELDISKIIASSARLDRVAQYELDDNQQASGSMG